MKQIVINVLIVIFLLCFASCGKSNEKKSESTKETSESQLQQKDPFTVEEQKTVSTQLQQPLVNMINSQIATVTFDPIGPTVETDLIAIPKSSGELPPDSHYEFRWVVENKIIAGITGEKLGHINFKKNNWVFCFVKLLTSGGDSSEYRSSMIRIQNSPPRILQQESPKNYSIPGTFTYQIDAIDPDGDKLTYRLISPQDYGIVLDPETGAMSWAIDEQVVKLIGDKSVKVIYEINDGVAQAQGSLTIGFETQK